MAERKGLRHSVVESVAAASKPAEDAEQITKRTEGAARSADDRRQSSAVGRVSGLRSA